MVVELVLNDVVEVVLISYVHARGKLPEEFRDALLHVASNAVVYLFPCSLDDVVDEVRVSGDLSFLASVNGVVIAFDSHQRFGFAMC